MASGCLAPNAWIDLQLTGTPSALVATPKLSAEFGNVLALQSDGIFVPGLTFMSGATFPTGAPDGALVVYRPAVGVAWTFRYAPSSGATDKWEFVGGGTWYADNEGVANFNPAGSNTWHDSPTPGPDIILPLSGVYSVRFGARINPAVSGNQAQAGISIGGVDPTDNNVVANGQANSISVARTIQVSVSGGTRLRMQYRDAATTGSNAFDNRFMEVQPVRCA